MKLVTIGIAHKESIPSLNRTKPLEWCYHVTVKRDDGDVEALRATSEELNVFAHFNRACIREIDRSFEPIAAKDWAVMVGDALDKFRAERND